MWHYAAKTYTVLVHYMSSDSEFGIISPFCIILYKFGLSFVHFSEYLYKALWSAGHEYNFNSDGCKEEQELCL